MAVFRKKRKNGTLSENWYFKFVVNGEPRRGSTYRTNKKEAIAYEEDLKRKLRALHDDRPAVSEMEKERNLLNFREKITAEIQGESIDLKDVWEVFKEKAPAMMRRIPNEKGWAAKKTYWEDFLAFLMKKYPNCKNMRDVRPQMAQEYVSLLKTSGKFNKKVLCKGGSYKNKVTKLSASSVNEYITQIKQIFRIMANAAGLIENPFHEIKKMVNKGKKRDVFEIHDLEKIHLFLKSFDAELPNGNISEDDFHVIEAIFIIGINTGLRKGDICLLKWSDVDFHKKAISKELSKTKETVFIPISSILHTYLMNKKKIEVNEYVCPELATMYRDNPEGISYRFKKLLNHINIESVKTYTERSRKVSSKDIHSLRHTFCYLHGMQGTPLVVVQSMVGHMDKKMTESYMMHQTEELKREAIEKLAFKGFQSVIQNSLVQKKRSLHEQIENCQSEEILNQVELILQKGLSAS